MASSPGDAARDTPSTGSSRVDSENVAPLGREEYIEQAHFFRALAERLAENLPSQEVLQSVREEVLATTKLPMAIDFLLAELRHEGVFGPAMARLPHYFSPFQAFVVREAEDERGRFDLRMGLQILQRESEYRAAAPSRQGIFLYQFESLCRNRLGYDRGLLAVADDPAFDAGWREWILNVRRQIGMVDIADLIYVYSEHYRRRANREHSGRPDEMRRNQVPDGRDAARSTGEEVDAPARVLFGEREGRIALANRRKDPLYLFSSLQRQLGYPEVPRPKRVDPEQNLLPQLARRLEQFEARLKLVEDEQRGGIDLTKFYAPQPPKAES